MKLQHKDTGATIDVPDRADLGVYERSGWTPAPEPEPVEADVPEGSQLLPDVPPAEAAEAAKPKRRARPET